MPAIDSRLRLELRLGGGPGRGAEAARYYAAMQELVQQRNFDFEQTCAVMRQILERAATPAAARRWDR